MRSVIVKTKKIKKMNISSFKTKLYGSALFAGLSIFSLKAQETRKVDDFTGIRAGDALKIIISQSDVASVKIDAPAELQSYIKTEVKDSILSISTDGNMKDDQDITILVTVKSLNSLENSGVADIKSENKLICENLTLQSLGVGNMNLDIEAKEVKAKVGGAGNITLKGNTQLLDVQLSGAGNLKASDLEANKVVAHVSGAGDAKVNAIQSLTATVSGAGSIIYKGSPIDRNVDISGAGSVRESKSGNGEETASDTTRIKWRNKKYIIIDDDDKKEEEASFNNRSNRDFKYWRGIDLGVNGFLNHKAGLNVPDNATYLELDYGRSIQLGVNIFQRNFHIHRNLLNLYTGLGFDFNHYALERDVTLKPGAPRLIATTDSSINFKKNNLNVTYLKAPLMIELNTSKNPRKNFHIAVGAELLYRIFAVTKQTYEKDDKHYKIKQRNAFHLEPFIYNAVARIGYNNISVYATYGFTRLFKKDQAPQVYPFAAGITLTI